MGPVPRRSLDDSCTTVKTRDPRVSASFSLPIHSELSRKRIERAFGRIAFHFPDALLME